MSVPKQSFVFPSSSAQKKKQQSLGLSRNRVPTASSQKLSASSPDACIFCNKKDSASKKQYFPSMINKALYSKYSSSQNYYYTKDINDILTNTRTTVVVNYKDSLTADEEEEFLKRFYKASEYDYKRKMLTEYYKFHKDISRLFMQPTTNVLNKYHDKKRRLEYIRVTKMLRDENEAKNPSPRPKEKPRAEEKAPVIMDRILDNLEITDDHGNEQPNKPKAMNLAKTSNNLRPGTSGNNKHSSQKPVGSGLNLQKALMGNIEGNQENYFVNYGKPQLLKHIPQGQAPSHKGDQMNQSNNHSISNTIQDLNMKLGEIISNNSRNYGNYFENPVASSTVKEETITNLDKFLTFLKKNPQQQRMNDIPEIIATDRYHHRYSNTLSDLPLKNLGYQSNSVPTTYRGHETDAPTLEQQVNSHARTISQSGSQNKGSQQSSGGRIHSTAQQNNYVNPVGYNDFQGSTYRDHRLHTDRPQTSLSLIKTQTKTGNSLVSKIKNFDEALKQNEQNIGIKIYSSQNSQRSVSRDSKRGASSNQNLPSRKNSISKTPRTMDTGLREPSISKNLNTEFGINKPGSLVKSSSKLNLKNADSVVRSSVGSTQGSSKLTTKVEYILGIGNSNQGQINSARGTSVGGTSQKTHSKGSSGNVGHLVSSGSKDHVAGLPGAKLAASLTSQNFYGHSRSHSNLNGHNPAITQTLRDLKSKGTYYEQQRRPPSGFSGSLSKRDLVQYTETNRLSTQNNGEPLMTEALNSARPSSNHKHTKSESKYNKLDSHKGTEIGFRMEEPVINRNLFQDTQGKSRASVTKPVYGNLISQNTSPSKPIYTYNQNNIVNIFLHPNQEAQKDANIIIKTETDRLSKNNRNLDAAQYDFTISNKVTPKKVLPHETQLSNDQLNSHRIIPSTHSRNGSSHTSPLKVSKKEDIVNAARAKQTGTHPIMSATATNFLNKKK